MSHARTTAVIISLTLGMAIVLQTTVRSGVTPAHANVTARVVPMAPLGAIEDEPDIEIIDGVRIVAETRSQEDLARKAVAKYADAGWPIDNTEIRYDEDACDKAVGYHVEEHGHHVVVMCNEIEWTLLHELGHVWSDLYLDEAERSEWNERRGVASWSEGEWRHRGTEHAADILAFALNDTSHVPTAIGFTSYRALLDDVDWLLGIEPLHRQGTTG